jgi:molybdopterin/thiamine biosynthesis adenylyltransferase
MNHDRHIGIFNASNLSVSLIGAGGIGAMTALMLAKMGVEVIAVYDDDIVSPENLATQLHRLDTIGQPKVTALQQTLAAFSDDTLVLPCQDRVTANKTLYGKVVISAVDSIQARKDIWAAVNNGSVGWYIDARMSAEEFQMYTIDMENQERVAKYDEMIASEDDSRIPDAPCTSKATFFCAALSSAIIGRTVRKIVCGIVPPRFYLQNLITDVVISIKG